MLGKRIEIITFESTAASLKQLHLLRFPCNPEKNAAALNSHIKDVVAEYTHSNKCVFWGVSLRK